MVRVPQRLHRIEGARKKFSPNSRSSVRAPRETTAVDKGIRI
jgi:hypothetical protein